MTRRDLLRLAFVLPQNAAGSDAWKTFRSRGGWSVRYPPEWRVSSYRQCDDLTAAGIFVSFQGSSDRENVMIQPLADKPARSSAEEWANDSKRTAVLIPLVREEWITVDRARALRVLYRGQHGPEFECVYVVRAAKTFMLSADADCKAFRPVLETFRFSGR